MSSRASTGAYPGTGGTPLGKNEWLALLALTALAALLRLVTLGTPSLWFDELATWKVCHQASLQALLTTGLADDIHLPGYFVITYALTKNFGDSEFILRLPAAIFSIASVPAIYALARRLCGKTVAAMSAVFTALSFTCIRYGMEARPYSMMMFFAIVTTHLWYGVYEMAIVRAERPTSRQLLTLFVALALACYSHYFSVLMVALQLCLFLVLALRAKRGAQVVGLMTAGLVLIAVPWVPELRLQMSQIFNWTSAFGFAEAFQKYILFLFFASPAYVSYVAVVVMLGALFKRETHWLRSESMREQRLGVFFLATWLVPFIILESVSLTLRPVFVDRYLSFCLPFAYMGISLQISRLKAEPMARIAVVLAVGLLMLLWLEETSHRLSQPKRDDWRRVEDNMGKNLPPDATVAVFAVTERVGVAQYYLERRSPNLAIDGEAAKLDQVEAAWSRVMAKKPDFIWLFHGQVAEPVTVDALNAAGQKLQSVSTGPIGQIEDHNVGAILFPVNKE